jgi:cell division protein FtsZ
LEVSITGAKGVLFAIAGGEDLGMLEIQDSARVITESIDPQARVIFGAIRDEKLKKNELKVTVIATGFPEEDESSSNYTISRQAPVASEVSKSIETLDEEDEAPARGKIFNSLSSGKKPEQKPTNATANSTKPELPKRDPKPVDPADDNDDDDDWGAVPAFLRRSKLK